MSNVMELIEKFLDLDGATAVHIIVVGKGGRAEMVLPLSAPDPQESQEPVIEVVPIGPGEVPQ